MSTHLKQTFFAMLLTSALAVPSAAEAKGGHAGGGNHEAREQSRGHGGHGGGRKQADGQQARGHTRDHEQAQREPAASSRQSHGGGKHARDGQQAPFASVILADRPHQPRMAKSDRKSGSRRFEVVQSQSSQTGASHRGRDFKQPRFARSVDREPDRKADKRALKQQRASYRLEEKQERRWAKQEQKALKQSGRVEPIVRDERTHASVRPARSYIGAPLYLNPSPLRYRSYPAGYGYPVQYRADDAYGYAGSYSYPQSYAGSASYSPYRAGYDSAGLRGLFGGGGGGLGDILGTLLPLLLGNGLGLGGFGGDQLMGGLLGSSSPGSEYPGDYDSYDQSGAALDASAYAEPDESAYLDPPISDDGASGTRGDSLMSLVQLALGSGLLGGGNGLDGLGALSGLSGGFDGSRYSQSEPAYSYGDTYTNRSGLLADWGL